MEKDRDVLLACHDFRGEHWAQFQTPNPSASAFVNVRLCHRRTKGCGSGDASLRMIFMSGRPAERHWRRLKGENMIVHVIKANQFKNNIVVLKNAA
ncbi:MAG: hypothetical protein N3D11_10835 [Candidatus Sumerlaeia bacterium]|nr:hypothetical protein [Candidatus Sumerlaeia bacterium]